MPKKSNESIESFEFPENEGLKYKMTSTFNRKSNQSVYKGEVKNLVGNPAILSALHRKRVEVKDLVKNDPVNQELREFLRTYVDAMEKGKLAYQTKKADRLPFLQGETFQKSLTDVKEAVDMVEEEKDPELRKQYASDFIDLYDGMLIWMKPDKSFETKEEGEARKKFHYEIWGKSISDSDKKNFPGYKMGDIAYIWSRLRVFERSFVGSESVSAHEKFRKWELRHTSQPMDDFALMEKHVLDTMSEFAKISDPPNNGRVIEKLENMFLQDDRTKPLILALKAAGKVKHDTADARQLLENVYETYKLTNKPSALREQVLASFEEKKTCFFEAQTPGGCTKGDECKRSHDPDDLKKFREVLAKKAAKSKRGGGKGGKGGKGDLKCDICKKSGHLAKNCFKAGENRSCYNCKEKGHLAKDCPKPKKIKTSWCRWLKMGRTKRSQLMK